MNLNCCFSDGFWKSNPVRTVDSIPKQCSSKLKIRLRVPNLQLNPAHRMSRKSSGKPSMFFKMALLRLAWCETARPEAKTLYRYQYHIYYYWACNWSQETQLDSCFTQRLSFSSRSFVMSWNKQEAWQCTGQDCESRSPDKSGKQQESDYSDQWLQWVFQNDAASNPQFLNVFHRQLVTTVTSRKIVDKNKNGADKAW